MEIGEHMAWEDKLKARYDVSSLQEEFRERLYNSPPAIDESQINRTNSAGVHRSPATLFRDAIERSLGWASETELRDIVFRYTGVRMGLGESNRFSQEVADIVVRSISER